MSGRGLEVAIVADDLTGALDMAAPFASRGFATQLLLDHEKASDLNTEVLTLTSASRELPPHAAAENIRVAMHVALARKPRILISKIDSTLTSK
jgi:D-threonate/D-erythronate kinase